MQIIELSAPKKILIRAIENIFCFFIRADFLSIFALISVCCHNLGWTSISCPMGIKSMLYNLKNQNPLIIQQQEAEGVNIILFL